MKRFVTISIIWMVLYWRAKASPAIYTLSGTGTGNLGGTAFSGAAFVITSTADTTNITASLTSYGPLLLVPDFTTTISVSGVGSAAFTTLTYSFDNSQSQAFGICNTNILDILDLNNSLFSGYGLNSSLGPLAGTSIINQGTAFETTAGAFSFDSVSSVTFQADVIPEPSAFTLLSVMLVGIVLWRQGRKGCAA